MSKNVTHTEDTYLVMLLTLGGGSRAPATLSPRLEWLICAASMCFSLDLRGFRARARQIHLYVPGKVGDRKPRFPYHLHAHLAFWSPGLEVATFSNTWPSSLGAFFKSFLRFAHFGRGFPFRVSNSCAAPNSKDLLPVLYFSLTQLFALFVKMCPCVFSSFWLLFGISSLHACL